VIKIDWEQCSHFNQQLKGNYSSLYKTPFGQIINTTKPFMGILPRYNQLWVDDPRLVNFWVNYEFSLYENTLISIWFVPLRFKRHISISG
jgi:hypothetical protein